jgi:hypothetical protein
MEKLRFTQLFHESEKILTDEEKKDIILKAFPDDEKAEIEEEYLTADFDGKLEEFFDKYKDILDNAKSEESNDDTTSETDSSNEIESSDEKPTEDENVDSDNTNSDVEANEESEEQLEMEEESAAGQDSTIKNGKSTLNLNDKYHDKLVEVLGITPNMEKDFEKYEEYFGYTSTGKKDSVKVMFSTPENWPIKTGDSIKSDNPLFHTVACMNEFLIWKMGVQIYNNNPKIKGIFNTVLNSGKAGSALNAYVKEHADETKKNIRIAIEEIRTGSTVIDDPFETGENVTQNNNIILFMFTKIFPTLLNVAKTGTVGGKFASATSKILGKDTLYGKLYLIGRGEYEATPEDVLNDLILDSYVTFLGGRFAVRAPYESEIKRGRTLFGNANAKPLCIFDDNWLENSSAEAKNVYQKMDTAFSEKNEKFEIRNTRKTSGKGATKAIGTSDKAYALAAKGVTEDELKGQEELGAITKDDARDVMKARQNVTTETIELEPFAYIANTVGADFNNFLSCMTRVGANKVGIRDVYGKQFYSEEDIENEKDPKKKEEMLEINKRWADARTKIVNFNPMSISTPTQGKDGDAGTLEDTLAAPSDEVQRELKEELPKEFDNIKRILDNLHNQIKSKLNSDNKDNNDIGRRFFSLLKIEQMLYASFKWLGYSPRQAFNFAFGYMYRNSTKKVDKAIIKPGLWNRLAVTSSTGTANNPDFGIGNTETRDLKNNTLIDSLYTLHNDSGLWFLDKTTEGLRARENFLKLLESYYSTTIGEFKDFVRPLQAKQSSSEVNLEDYINGLNVNVALWRPGESYMPNEINQAAFGVSMQGVMMKNQEDSAKVSKWVRTLLSSNVNAYSFDPVLNPSSPTFEKNSDMVNTIKEITGINMYDYWDGQKVKKNELLAAFKNWEKESGDVFQIYGNDTNYASLNDKVDNEFYNKSPNVLLGTEKTSNKNGDFTRHRMVLPSDPDLVNRVSGITIPEALETFFGEVFREASEKEKTKKQRFTIN